MLNRWIGIGRLTKDPDLRYTPSGTAYFFHTSAGAKDKRGDIMTNYELIKNMSIEEMAVTITCPNEMGMADIECDKSDECNCCECCLGWLQQEAGAEANKATTAMERIAPDRYKDTAERMARGE